MRKSQVKKTMKLARELIDLGNDLLVYEGSGESNGDHIWGSKISGSLRRKSMDLTRELTQLRKY